MWCEVVEAPRVVDEVEGGARCALADEVPLYGSDGVFSRSSCRGAVQRGCLTRRPAQFHATRLASGKSEFRG